MGEKGDQNQPKNLAYREQNFRLFSVEKKDWPVLCQKYVFMKLRTKGQMLPMLVQKKMACQILQHFHFSRLLGYHLAFRVLRIYKLGRMKVLSSVV